MVAIGGYFSLELPRKEEYHPFFPISQGHREAHCLKLNTGRNCLEYILRSRNYKKVYIPYYTCDAVLEPLAKLDVGFEFYHLNQDLEISSNIHLSEDEALLYINYYGLKQTYIETLATLFGKKLIIDNTQAFYAKPLEGIDCFYSCRKFFGVPDGAYLYIWKELEIELQQDSSLSRMSHLLKRIEFGAEEGFADFQVADGSLVKQPIKRMSHLTERLMQSIDYKSTAERRRSNYLQLEQALGGSNPLNLTMEQDAVPMVYPYMAKVDGLRERLIRNKVYVARYWPNIYEWISRNCLEYILAEEMIPLPVDQRYGSNEMNRIIQIIKS